MKAAFKFSLVRATRILMGGTLFAGIYIAFLVFGPTVESKYFPVTKYVEVTQQRDGPRLSIDAIFDKLRSCEFVGSTWYGITKDGVTERLPQTPLSTDVDRTRPVGRNYMRDWQVDIPRRDDIQKTFNVQHHRCGWPWLTQTIQGPYKLPGAN